MVKREIIQAKKCRADVVISGSNPSNCKEEANEQDDTNFASMDCLYEDSLIEILKWLPVKDRIMIERVSKKWNQAARKSWFNFRCMYCWKFSNSKSLLRRAGRFVDKLDMSNSGRMFSNSFVCEALSLAPNVKHLKLDLQSETHVLSKLVGLASQLRSFSIHLNRKPVSKALNKLLSKCNQLEHLELRKVKGYNFECLPSSLKSLVLGYEQNLGQLVEVIITQTIILESLTLPCFNTTTNHCLFLCKIDLSRLRHLSIHVCSVSWPYFAAVAGKLSKLISLELCITRTYGLAGNQVVDTIVNNMGQLKFLSIVNFYQSSLSNIFLLANLKNLTHVSIASVTVASVCQLLHALILQGDLQYFYTDSGLPLSLLCYALCQGKNLTHIYVEWVDNNTDDDLIGKALNKVFGKGTLPDSPDDPRIRHIYCGYRRLVDATIHPWAVFHNTPSTFPRLSFSDYNVFSTGFHKWW